MNALLVGGAGFIGSRLSRELLDRGDAVTVLSRSPDRADLPQEVRTVAADVTDYDSIASAFADQDVVVNLVALSPLYTPLGGNEMHERVHLGGTRNVVDAAEAHGVSRLVQLSALGADPDGDTAYIRAKGEAEAVVRDSSLEWVLIRPSVVFGDGGEFVDFTTTLTTPYVTGLPGGGQTRFQPLWVGDLVSMLAEAATDEKHAGHTYELGGPEVLTLADVAKLVYRSRGKPLAVLPIPMGLAKVGLTLGGTLPGFPMGPDQYRSLQFDNTVTENDVTAFGRDPSSLRTLPDYLDTARNPTGGSKGPADGSASPAETTDDRSTDGGLRSASTSPTTLLLFGYLALAWQLPHIVDIYSSVVYGALFTPPYVVNLLFYDSPWGLEQLVYPVAPYLPVPGDLLWEAGLVLTYYLFAIVVVWLGRRTNRWRRSGTATSGESAL